MFSPIPKCCSRGRTGPARCEEAAWFISLRWLVLSQKFRLPIIIIIITKMPLHSSKVTFPAEAERVLQQRGSRVQVAAGCGAADPLRGLLMPNPDGWKGRNAFPVNSPLVAVACSGVNPPPPHTGARCSPHMGPGQAWDSKIWPLTLVPGISESDLQIWSSQKLGFLRSRVFISCD